jgi:hypothetical protein
MALYTKTSAISRRTYYRISQQKKRHVRKNLVLKALQVKMYTNDNTTSLQIFIHNPEAFYAIQHDYYGKVTTSRLVLLRKKHTTFLTKQLAATQINNTASAVFDC